MLRSAAAAPLLILLACGDSPSAVKEWCKIEYYFPPIPAEYATDSIHWLDPNAPTVSPDSVVIQYCDGTREVKYE